MGKEMVLTIVGKNIEFCQIKLIVVWSKWKVIIKSVYYQLKI